MRKNINGVTAIFVVNVAIVAGIALHKKYKPQLEQISKQYVHLKTNSISKKKNINYKKEINKLLEDAKEKIADVGDLIKEVWDTYSVQDIQEESPISKNIETLICEKLETTYFNSLPKSKALVYVSSDNSTPIHFVEETAHPFSNPEYLKQVCITLALIFTLNTLGLSQSIKEQTSKDTMIIEDVVDFLAVEEAKHHILQQTEAVETKAWSIEEKIEFILLSNKSYEDKFDQIIRMNSLSIEQAMATIMHSNITSYENIFNYILEIPGLPYYEKMNFIVNADSVHYEEKFEFIMSIRNLSTQQKIWSILQISNTSFEQVWSDLLELEGITYDEIIKSIIDADIVSFDILFDHVLQLNELTKEKLTNYLLHYHASYNFVSDTELIQYILNLDYFTKEEKLDCIWKVLSKHPLNKRIEFICNYYNITYEDYLGLYQTKNNLTEEQSIIWDLMSRVNTEKEKYILEHYDFESKEELDIVVAGVAAEGANSYDDLYWVTNTIFNRITNVGYVNQYGTNPYRQFIAKSQFAVYEDGSYLLYLYPHNSLYQLKYELARQSFYDMFYESYNHIEHSYKEFRSWNTENYSNTYIVRGGNRYGNPMSESSRIVYEELIKDEKDTSGHTLVKTIVTRSKE